MLELWQMMGLLTTFTDVEITQCLHGDSLLRIVTGILSEVAED